MALVYSCCFWFSLRLGGILIGIFALGLVILVFCCLGYSQTQLVKDEINNWTNDYNLIYAKSYLENIQADPDKYLSLGISFTSIYMIACIIYIYGAYTCNNMLMVTYILLELLRLILISTLVATFLLLIKQNTMDIGLLIGASVAGGFLLLGMFYLWVCAANLPMVINEMERDEQAAIINKLQQLVEVNNRRTVPRGLDNIPFSAQSEDIVNRNVFIVPRKTGTQGKIPIQGAALHLSPKSAKILSVYQPITAQKRCSPVTEFGWTDKETLPTKTFEVKMKGTTETSARR